MRIKRKVYLETSVVSYLTAKPSRDPLRAARQKATQEWWVQRKTYDLFASQLVIDEAQRGDSEAAGRRLAVLREAELLDFSPEVPSLAIKILLGVRLPAVAYADALHIATAAVYGLDCLVTWDLTHIANPRLRSRIDEAVSLCGYKPPFLCTPAHLRREV